MSMPSTAKKIESDGSCFSKEQLLSAMRFSNRRDLLGAILEDGKKYSIADVEKKLDDDYGKKVN